MSTGARSGRRLRRGDLLGARYELVEKLGEGGMGAVWKARDRREEAAGGRDSCVALKLVHDRLAGHPPALVALEREAAKQRRLAHPNVARVLAFRRDEATGRAFIAMELLEGEPLDAFVRRLPADGLPRRDVMGLVAQLGAGLAHAHAAGLVHCDLKPGNVFRTVQGRIKLLDFGIAHATAAATGTARSEPGRLVALTPGYAALELFEGREPDPRDDVFSLAVLTYQLLTGRHPYGKRRAPLAKRLGLVPTPAVALDGAQNRGLARALALHREARTATVDELLDAIGARDTAHGERRGVTRP